MGIISNIFLALFDIARYFRVGFYTFGFLKLFLAIFVNPNLVTLVKGQPDLKSYRLVMTLLDKAEVGGAILEHIMIDVFRAMFHSSKAPAPKNCKQTAEMVNKKSENVTSPGSAQQELIKSANLLFGTLESSFIWEFCGKTFEKASCQRFRISDTEVNAVNFIGRVTRCAGDL